MELNEEILTKADENLIKKLRADGLENIADITESSLRCAYWRGKSAAFKETSEMINGK